MFRGCAKEISGLPFSGLQAGPASAVGREFIWQDEVGSLT
jgi:hypothetical protein